MIRTVEVPGEEVVVHAEIGKGRVVKAILVIEEEGPGGGKGDGGADDPFGRELDELLAATESVSEAVDDSRASFYATDMGGAPRDQWEKDFMEMCALAPLNIHPADVSREAMYGPDPEELGEPKSP